MKGIWPIAIMFGLIIMVEVVYAKPEQAGTVGMQPEQRSVSIRLNNRLNVDDPVSPINIAQTLREQTLKPQVLKEQTIKPQVLREPHSVPRKRLKKLFLGARNGLKHFFKKIL